MTQTSILIFALTFVGVVNAQQFDVRDYGAVGDGVVNDQIAIQRAVDACNKAGGGTVLLKEGRFLSGQIQLCSNLVFQIEASATLFGIQSDAEEAYPHGIIQTKYPNRMLEDCQRRLLYGDHVRNVKITGGGTINGQGDFEPWMNVKELGTEKDRPSLIAFVASENVEVSNLTLRDPACWTQVYIESDSIVLRNLIVDTGNLTPNRDGIDIVDCHHVLIENCDIKSEDDGICFKSGSEYGVKKVAVRNCVIDKLSVNAGNCFKLGTDGLGSFMDFQVSGLTLKNAFQNSAIAIESMDGAIIDNLVFEDIEIENSGQAVFILLADRCRTVPNRKTRIGTISNVYFKDITGKNFTQQYPSIITGIPGHNIQNVTFENIHLEVKGGVKARINEVPEYDGSYPEGSKFGLTGAHGFYLRHVDEVNFINCEINASQNDHRPWLVQEDVDKVQIK